MNCLSVEKMAGKRFRRTTSMSHFAPNSANMAFDRSITQSATSASDSNNHYKVARPLVNDQKPANVHHNPHQEDIAIAESQEMTNLPNSSNNCGEQQEDIAIAKLISNSGLPTENIGVENVAYHPPLNMSHLVAYQMGLWCHANGNSALSSSNYNGAMNKQENHHHHHHHHHPVLSSPVDFLQVCFFCKRRLGNGRDIFIYRLCILILSLSISKP